MMLMMVMIITIYGNNNNTFRTCKKYIQLNFVFKSPLECRMLLCLRIKYLNALILCCYTSSRAILAIVFTLQNLEILFSVPVGAFRIVSLHQ